MTVKLVEERNKPISENAVKQSSSIWKDVYAENDSNWTQTEIIVLSESLCEDYNIQNDVNVKLDCQNVKDVFQCFETNGNEVENGANVKNSQEIQQGAKLSDYETPLTTKVSVNVAAPDGGWGWAVVFGAFLVSFLMTGLLKSFGILYVALMETFPDSTPGNVAWIPGILNTLSLVLSPISNALSSRFGCRKVVFAGGLIASLGMGLSSMAPNIQTVTLTSGGITGLGATLALTPSILLVGQYFEKKRALANSLSLCGSGLGGLVLPLFLDWCLERYGLRGTYLILSGLLLHICVSAMLYTPLDVYWKNHGFNNDGMKQVETEPSFAKSIVSLPGKFTVSEGTLKEEESCLAKLGRKIQFLSDKIVAAFSLNLLTDRVFMLIVMSVVFMSMGSPHVLFFLPSYAESEYGLSKYMAALLLSIASAGDLSGRTFLGYLSDKKVFKRDHEYMAAIFASATATLAVALTSYYPLLSFCCFIYGVGTGTWQCFVPVLLADCLGADKLGGTLALSRMFQGLSNLMVPVFVGYILNITGHYTYVFLWMACNMIIAGISVIFLPIELRKMRTRNGKDSIATNV